MNQKSKKHSTHKYFQFLPPLNKGGLISEGIYFGFGPIANKTCQIPLLSRIFGFSFHASKLIEIVCSGE